MEELKTAILAAKKAGKALMQNIEKKRIIEFKGANNIVTDADKESEKIIIKEIHSKYPNHSILSEEAGSINNNSPFLWVIDPLDGTNNYSNTYPVFCVSIALLEKNEIILGVVYDPNKDELFYAAKNQGSFLNLKKISVSKNNKLSDCLIATGFPYEKEKNKNLVTRHFSKMYDNARDIRRGGSAAIDMCYVACGRLDGYYEDTIKPWDIAAGKIILETASGKATDIDGNEWTINSNNILASNKLIHKELFKTLGGIK